MEYCEEFFRKNTESEIWNLEKLKKYYEIEPNCPHIYYRNGLRPEPDPEPIIPSMPNPGPKPVILGPKPISYQTVEVDKNTLLKSMFEKIRSTRQKIESIKLQKTIQNVR